METINRSLRYQAILPIKKMQESCITIIGVGAVGRQVALQLAAMGVLNIQIYDFDTVEDVNLGPQGYLEGDLGKTKVQATSEMMLRLNPKIVLNVKNERFHKTSRHEKIVFSCVDNIDVRQLIYDNVKEAEFDLFVDGRMAAEVFRLITASDTESMIAYQETLFSAAEAHPAPCTAKSTIYCANVLAGLMVAQYAKWLREIPTNNDFCMNILSTEMFDS